MIWKMVLAALRGCARVSGREFRLSDFWGDHCVEWIDGTEAHLEIGDTMVDVKTEIFRHYYQELPEDVRVLSTCDTPGCLNPTHFNICLLSQPWAYVESVIDGSKSFYWLTHLEPDPLSLCLTPRFVRRMYESTS